MAEISRLVFFGTPDFAVPTLRALVAAGRAPRLVVVQPSRPVGRGQRVQAPPVARAAEELGLPLAQPAKVREPEFLQKLAEHRPDLAVVVAFGQIFPRSLLALPRLGCVNLHASLLPRWRGAAPIQAAIAAGDEETGVTTMQMEAGLDSGPILLEERTRIGERETAGELSARLAEAGAALVVRTVARLEAGDLVPRPQGEEGVTLAPRLTRESGRADWSLAAAALANRLRAFTPWPGCSASWRGEPVKLIAAEPLASGPAEAEPGTVLGLEGGLLAVACGAGSRLGIRQLQKAGKRPVDAASFVNGERLRSGERFA